MAVDTSRKTEGIALPYEISSEIWSKAQESSAVMQLARRVNLPGAGLEFQMSDVGGVSEGYWIGLERDPSAPGDWVENWTWVSGEPYDYTNWDVEAGEPNNVYGSGENKGIFWSSTGLWNDLRTDDSGQVAGYIIEWDL